MTTETLALFKPKYATNHRGEAIEACSQVDPEVMFPANELERGHPDVKAAKRVCGRCEFRDSCLDGALARREEFGVWGGLTKKEREALRKSHQRAQRLF